MNWKRRSVSDLVVWRDEWDGDTVGCTLWKPLPHGGWELVVRRLRPGEILAARRHGIQVCFAGRKEGSQ